MPVHLSQDFTSPNRNIAPRRLFVASTILFALAFASGCGGTGDVSGKVYYQGKVVTSGNVVVVGADGIAKNGTIAEDGSYKVERVPVGEAKIAVSSPPVDPNAGRKVPQRLDPETGKPVGPPPEAPVGPTYTETQKKTWREVPARYADVTKTTLKLTVSSGPNPHDIKLD